MCSLAQPLICDTPAITGLFMAFQMHINCPTVTTGYNSEHKELIQPHVTAVKQLEGTGRTDTLTSNRSEKSNSSYRTQQVISAAIEVLSAVSMGTAGPRYDRPGGHMPLRGFLSALSRGPQTTLHPKRVLCPPGHPPELGSLTARATHRPRAARQPSVGGAWGQSGTVR